MSDSDSGAETKAKETPKKRKLSKSSSKKSSKKKVKKSKIVEDSDDDEGEKVGWLIAPLCVWKYAFTSRNCSRFHHWCVCVWSAAPQVGIH